MFISEAKRRYRPSIYPEWAWEAWEAAPGQPLEMLAGMAERTYDLVLEYLHSSSTFVT